MNSKERSLIAMTGGKPDRVPVIPQLCPPHAIRVAGMPFRQSTVEALENPEKYDLIVGDCAVTYGLDGFRVWMGSSPRAKEWHGDKAYAVDPSTGGRIGTVDFQGGGGVLTLPDRRRSLTDADIETVDIPVVEDLIKSPLLRPTTEVVAKYGRSHCIIGVPGQFTIETMNPTQGIEATLLDVLERPSFIRRWTERHLEVSIRRAQAMAQVGVDAFYIGETFGQFLSADNFRDLCVPYFQQFVSSVRPLGKPIYLHMCGRVTHLLDEVAKTGVDCFEPLDEVGGTRVADVKARLGGRMALMGGVRTDLLAHGSLEEVENECRRCIRQAAADGGYILAAGDMLPTETEPEKVRAMVRIAETEGRY